MIDSLLVTLTIGVLLLNIPFGMWRSKTERLSLQWLAAIHLPVLLVFILRSLTGYSYKIIPLLLLASVAGQILGGKLLPAPQAAKVSEEDN